MAIFVLACTSYSEIVAYSPVNGGFLWQHILQTMQTGYRPGEVGVYISVRGGVTSISSGLTMEILDRRGNMLFRENPPYSGCSQACPISVTGNEVLVSYPVISKTSAAYYLQAIDSASRKTLWRKREPTPSGVAGTVGGEGLYDDLVAGGKVSYGLVAASLPTDESGIGVAGEEAPFALDIIDPVTGRFYSQILPVSAASGFWLTSAGGILYLGYTTASGKGRLIAFRPASSQTRSTVDPAPGGDWPDPCSLITASEIEAERPRSTYKTERLSALLDDHVTRVRSGCSYQVADKSQILVVHVDWVAATAQGSAEIYSDLRRDLDARPLPGVHGKANYYYVPDPFGPPNEAIVRVGRVIASVLTLDSSFSLYLLAPSLADGLQRLGY